MLERRLGAFSAMRPKRNTGGGIPSPGLFSVPSPSVGCLSNSIYPLGRGAGVDMGKNSAFQRTVFVLNITVE